MNRRQNYQPNKIFVLCVLTDWVIVDIHHGPLLGLSLALQKLSVSVTYNLSFHCLLLIGQSVLTPKIKIKSETPFLKPVRDILITK